MTDDHTTPPHDPAAAPTGAPLGARGAARRAFVRDAALAGLGAAGLGAALAACARAGRAAAGAASPAAASPAAAAPAAAAPAGRIGVQLYTVRDLMQQDFEGTLARVAAIGYREVEFAGYYGRTPEQVRATLDRLGLAAPSSHIGVALLRADLAGQLRAARAIGHAYVTAPSYPIARTGAGEEAWKQAAAEFNRWGAACREQGLRFAYHNHDWELRPIAGGRSGLDVLIAETDPALVDFELDLYWAVHAGRDPLQLFGQYPGRVALWHVKDMREPQGAKAMAPVGGGAIDFRAIFAQRGQSGLRHFFVEHDNAAQVGGSLPSIEASYAYLRRLLA